MAETPSNGNDDMGGIEALARAIELVPYAHFLGLTAQLLDGAPVLRMPADDRLIGNPILPALHGGTVGALLETAALAAAMSQGRLTRVPKTITITIDYLRFGRIAETLARASLTKQGKRVMTVSVEAFQADPDKPIARANAHLLLRSE